MALEWFIGVDPGNDGGLGLIDSKGRAVKYCRMPDVSGISKFFFDAVSMAPNVVICIFEEHKGGKAGGSSAAAHNSAGRYIGMIQMACAVHGVELRCVTPQSWKAQFKLINKTAKGAEKIPDKEKREMAKKASIALCREFFPGVNLLATPKCSNDHDGIAESLLLAKAGQMRELEPPKAIKKKKSTK